MGYKLKMTVENKKISVAQLMASSGVQFGTSGVRGKVVEMTDEVCWIYTTAFLRHLALQPGTVVGIAGDLRASTERIMQAVSVAVSNAGLTPVNFGRIPSPAIALYGLHSQIPTIMVTGSHIPEDRNGIKFNKADGEILKADEQQITAQEVEIPAGLFTADGTFINEISLPEYNDAANTHYIQRFIDFFPVQCLTGKAIGLYQHSSVARQCLKTILERLGATVTVLAPSDTFVAVDTEAIRSEDIALAKQWAEQYRFDCIISTDGDGDRPLISDEYGVWLRGDIAGILCARYFNADVVVTPVSSNSAVDLCNSFKKVVRTKIGSPYVIEAMNAAMTGDNIVVGYEANGGFLTATPISQNGQILPPLATRDAVIVPLAILMLAQQQNASISGLLRTLPARYTASDRLKAFPTELSRSILGQMQQEDNAANLRHVTALFADIAGQPVAIDNTDGVRISFTNGTVIHLRASGNAPELRCYTEADSEQAAQTLNDACMAVMRTWQS